MSWGVLISGNGSNLQALIETGELQGKHGLSLVIASTDKAYGILRARRAGIPVEILPKELRPASQKQRAEEWMIEAFKKCHVTHLFLAGYMKIVSPTLIHHFKNKIYNIHPSLLPKYKGLDALMQAINAGEKEVGVSIHHVVPDVDSGKIILQRRFDVLKDVKAAHLWLHIQEQYAVPFSVRKVICHDQLM